MSIEVWAIGAGGRKLFQLPKLYDMRVLDGHIYFEAEGIAPDYVHVRSIRYLAPPWVFDTPGDLSTGVMGGNLLHVRCDVTLQGPCPEGYDLIVDIALATSLGSPNP